MPNPNRIKLSLADTAAVVLASLPLAVTPANAEKVTKGTSSSIGLMVSSSNAAQFSWTTRNGPSVSQLAAEQEGRNQVRTRNHPESGFGWLWEWLGWGSGSSIGGGGGNAGSSIGGGGGQGGSVRN